MIDLPATARRLAITQTEPASRAARLLPYLLAAALGVVYATISVGNHRTLGTTGYDLGIFEQAVRAYAEGRAPVSDLLGPGFHLLGDHFHPILMLLGPIYALFPGAVTLLIAQAVLVAISAIPVTRIAVEAMGVRAGAAVGVAYGLSWGLLSAVDFDFHEIAFAVPLLAFSLEKLVRQQWLGAVLWALPLILVKEDLPITVAAIGGYLVLKGQRKLGAIVIAGSLAAFALIVLVVIPSFNPGGGYTRFGTQLGSDTSLLDTLLSVPEQLVTPDIKLLTLVALLAPTAFLALFSPITLIALPTLLWRFVSTNPSYWGMGFHYSAVLMPIVYIGLIHAVGNAKPELSAIAFTRLRRVVVGMCVVSAVLALVRPPISDELDGSTTRTDQQIAGARRILGMVPPGTTVAASNPLVPQLTATNTVQLFPSYQGSALDAEWVVVDTENNWPYAPEVQVQQMRLLSQTDYDLVAEDTGYVLLHRRAGSQR